MSPWWDDFFALLFKRAVLISGQAWDVAIRYLRIVQWVTVLGIPAAAFFLWLGWLFAALIVLVVMGVVYLPILLFLQASYGVLPERLQKLFTQWLRLWGAVLFATLLTLIFIDAFNLWRSGTALLILMVLALGVAIGWWRITDRIRTTLGAKLLLILFGTAIVAKFPIVSEALTWGGDRIKGALFVITRPPPERYYPGSADELRDAFVDRGTGEFLIWYYRDQHGNYEFYKGKGYDDVGRPFRHAVTQKEFDEMVAWQRAQDSQREAMRRAQEKEAALRRAQEQKERERLRERAMAEYTRHSENARTYLGAGDLDAVERALDEADGVITANRGVLEEATILAAQRDIASRRREIEAVRIAEQEREAERLRLASYVISFPDKPVDYIVFFVDSRRKTSTELTSAVVDRLRTRNIDAAGDVFSDEFAAPQGFDAFAAGRGGADIAAMNLSQVADRLLLIRAGEPQSNASATVSRVRTYSMPMAVSVISATDGRKLSEFVMTDVAGAGVTETAARLAFIQRFAEAVVARPEVLDGLR